MPAKKQRPAAKQFHTTTCYAFDVKAGDEVYLQPQAIQLKAKDHDWRRSWRTVAQVEQTSDQDLVRFIFSDGAETELASATRITIRRPLAVPQEPRTATEG